MNQNRARVTPETPITSSAPSAGELAQRRRKPRRCILSWPCPSSRPRWHLIALTLFLVCASLAAGQSPFTGTFDFSLAYGLGTTINYNGSAIPNLTVGPLTKVGVTDTSSTGNCRANAWSTGSTDGSATPGGSFDPTKYFQFTITAAPGYTISNPALSFGVGRSATGPRQFEWRSSVTNFLSAIPITANNAALTKTANNVLQTPDSGVGYTGNTAAIVVENLTTITFRFYAYGAESTTGTGGLQGNLTFTGTLTPPPGPVLFVNGGTSAIAAAFSATYGSPSPAQSFNITGTNLAADIVVTGPAGFEVSTDGASYAESASIPQNAGSASATLRVRLKANAPAGSYNAQSIAVTSTDAAGVNIATSASGNLVSPATLTVTGVSAMSRTYDGTITAQITGSPIYQGLVNGETFEVSGTPTAQFETAGVGIGKPVVVSGYVAPSGNYVLTQPSGLTADITPRALRVTANNAAKVYGTTLSGGVGQTAFTVAGLAGDETVGSVTLVYLDGDQATDAPGSYPGVIVPSDATGGTFASGNYSITYVAGDLSVAGIPAIAASGVLGAVNTTYGAPSPIPASFNVAAEYLSSALILSAPAGYEISPAAASGYSASLTFPPIGGSIPLTTIYVRLSETATVAGSPHGGDIVCASAGAASVNVPAAPSTVAPATLTIEGIAAADKTYDGTNAAGLTGTPAYVGLVNGESFPVSGTPVASFATKNVGASKSVSITGYAAPSSNYVVVQPNVAAAIIARPLTISAAAVVSKAYDGTNAAVIHGTLADTVPGDDVTFEGVGTFAAVGPGTGIPVTASCTLSGTDAANYSLTQPTGLVGSITADTNANLSGLLLSSGSLTPPFSPAATAYSVTVSGDVAAVSITPTAAFASATIAVNGTPVTSGVASSPINLSLGNNVIPIVVTAQDPSVTKTYTVTVNRGGNGGVLSFAAAAINVNPLKSAGQPNTVQVQINRASAIGGEVSVTVTAAQSSSVPSGQVKLAEGVDYIFEPNPCVVTFADGETSKVVSIPLTATARFGQFYLELSNPTGGASISTLPGESKAFILVQKKDTLAPVLTVTTPVPDAAGNVIIAGTAIDSGTPSTGINRVELAVKHINSAGGPVSVTVGPGGTFSEPVRLEQGKNTITVTAYDGSGLKTAKTFSFTFNNPDLPMLAGTYAGLVKAVDEVSNDTTGFIAVTVTSSASASGKITIGGASVGFSGALDNAGDLHFKPAYGTAFDVIDRTEYESYLGVLSVHVGSGGVDAEVKTAPDGAVLASATARKLDHSAAAGLLNGGNAQKYTVAFPSQSQVGLAPSEYPQGHGFATATVTPNGAVSLKGALADGTVYSAAGRLRLPDSATQAVVLHANLYRKSGCFATELLFDLSTAANPDADVLATDSLWIRPALPRSRYYKSGWPAGVKVNAFGSRFTLPNGASFLPGLSATIPNATLIFAEGNLPGPISRLVHVSTNNASANRSSPLDPALKLSLSAKTGQFQGNFTNDTDGKTTGFKGVVLQEGANAGGYGYFLSTPASAYGAVGVGGTVTLRANP